MGCLYSLIWGRKNMGFFQTQYMKALAQGFSDAQRGAAYHGGFAPRGRGPLVTSGCTGRNQQAYQEWAAGKGSSRI
jgi:hypothetical protein